MPPRGLRADLIAALVNGTVVLFVPPLALLALALFGPDHSNMVHPAGWSRVLSALPFVLGVGVLMSPLALVAAWRTQVHATRWLAGERSWRGVAEAGATAFGVALLVLAPGIVFRTAEAAPYVLVYGGAALIFGIAVGLLLHATAVVALRLSGTTAA